MVEVVRNTYLTTLLIIMLALFSISMAAAKDNGESTQSKDIVTRGIGGTRPGQSTGHVPEGKQKILNAIEQAYDESYGELINSFLNAADREEKSVSTFPELTVEIDVVREVSEGGRSRVVPVLDGDTLTQNENYKIQFRCSEKCYLYIAQLDSTGKMDPIFPGQFATRGNPLTPDTLYSVPSDNYWLYLDENVGKETIYVIASRTRRADIELIFNKLSERSRNLVQQSPVSLDTSYVLTRGIGGTRKGRDHSVSFQDGSQGQYSSTQFSAEGADFVMTRWFYHR